MQKVEGEEKITLAGMHYSLFEAENTESINRRLNANQIQTSKRQNDYQRIISYMKNADSNPEKVHSKVKNSH